MGKRSLGTHIPPTKRARNSDDVNISNQVLPGIFDIKPPTPQYPIKTEPNSSPASPYQNYSPSVTPGPSDQQTYAPIPGPSTSTLPLPTFGDTWHGNISNLMTLGGGTFSAQNPQPFPPTPSSSLLNVILQYDSALLSEYVNASPAMSEPLNAYTCPNVSNPINNDEINNVNVDMASVEGMVASSDLYRVQPPVNDAPVAPQNDVQQLSENFNVSMNISGDYRDSLTRFVNETFDNKYNQ